MKPFEKEFYNSFNLTNLPRRICNWIEGNCPGAITQGEIVRWVIVWGAIGMEGNSPEWIVLGVISWGVIVWGAIVQGELF